MPPARSTPPTNVLDVFKRTQTALKAVVERYGFTPKSGGTRDLLLEADKVDPEMGYWRDPSKVSSKPTRWILQIDEASAPPTARLAQDESGAPYAGVDTVGYFNNRDRTCVVIVFRVLAAVRPASGAVYEFPGWEWLLVLGFPTPLPAGTSGDTIREFNPVTATITHGTGDSKQSHNLGVVALVKTPPGPPIHRNDATASTLTISYDEATAAIARMLFPEADGGGNVFDGARPAEIQNLANMIDAMLQTHTTMVPTRVTPHSDLVGIPPSAYRQIDAALASGKKHLILYGPPGTGKTTLAKYLASELSTDSSSIDAYKMLTASTSWSSQDLIGGYQPLGAGQMGFIPGILLRNFDKPLVIDELNRCPIDKVIGPLFSILSEQATTLPYRVDVTNASSEFYAILPASNPAKQPHEFAPESHWRLICTLNTIDKTQLGQISYALSRRFAWIKIGVPDDLEEFVAEIAARLSFVEVKPEAGVSNPVAAMWRVVNSVREIGGAPIIDFIKGVRAMDASFDLFASPSEERHDALLDALRMFVLPLLEGVSRHEADDVSMKIAEAWNLGSVRAKQLERDLMDMAS